MHLLFQDFESVGTTYVKHVDLHLVAAVGSTARQSAAGPTCSVQQEH